MKDLPTNIFIFLFQFFFTFKNIFIIDAQVDRQQVKGKTHINPFPYTKSRIEVKIYISVEYSILVVGLQSYIFYVLCIRYN